MPTATAIIGERIYGVTVKIGTAHFPTGALRIGTKDESSFGRSHQQEEIPFLYASMSHAMQHSDPGRANTLIRAPVRRNDRSRLHGLQGGLYFARPLIALHGFFGEAALDNSPQARRHRMSQGLWNFAHDGRTDLKASASLERQPTRSQFIEHHSQGPEVAARVGRVAAKDLGCHVRQGSANTRRALCS